MDHVKQVSQHDFQAQVLNSAEPVLVDFYATWCGPCRLQAPVLNEVAEKFSGVRIVKVDVDQNRELARQYNISSLPSLVLFKSGAEAYRHLGLAGAAQVEAILRN